MSYKHYASGSALHMPPIYARFRLSPDQLKIVAFAFRAGDWFGMDKLKGLTDLSRRGLTDTLRALSESRLSSITARPRLLNRRELTPHKHEYKVDPYVVNNAEMFGLE